MSEYTDIQYALQAAAMAKKAKDAPAKQASATGYAAWKAAAVALLERPSTMREKRWRDLYIGRKSPEEAAEEAATHYSNTTRPWAGPPG